MINDQRPITNDQSRIFRCIAFDAVGTLIFAEPSVAAAYASIGQRFGSRATADEIAARFPQAFRLADKISATWFGELGRTNEEYERKFWQQIVREVLPDVHAPGACFEELFEHFARPESWRCFEDVGSTLAELQARGYAILIASNFDARLNRVCDGLAELRALRGRVISSLVGYRKAHRSFYAAVAAAAACDPREVLMIGDDFANDVKSARDAGFAAVHLCRDQASGGRQPPDGLNGRNGVENGLIASGLNETRINASGGSHLPLASLAELLERLP